MKYEVYLTGGEAPVFSFESDWKFSPGEIVFLHGDNKKRNFIIGHITHDINVETGHFIRIYCQERKVF